MPRADIDVQILAEEQRVYRVLVCVREGGDETSHLVTLRRDLHARLAPEESAEAFVRRCFAVMLERGPKEWIPEWFDLSFLARRSPEFEEAIARR